MLARIGVPSPAWGRVPRRWRAASPAAGPDHLSPGLGSSGMEILCADCGCRVDSGIRVAACSNPGCCCVHLPTREFATDEASDEPMNSHVPPDPT